MHIPDDHPRAASLRTRERMKDAVAAGLVHPTGLIAHGRGEAFDYLLGERTGPAAARAAHMATRVLLAAAHPVISLNGNVVALAAPLCVDLAEALPARLEVNLFHRSQERIDALVEATEAAGAPEGSVLGRQATARIPGLSSDRGLCEADGIARSDVVLVPLEDGDRAAALAAMGKIVIAIDLNPLSRTAATATVTIVDELSRALGHMVDEARAQHELGDAAIAALRELGPRAVLAEWDNERNLGASRAEMAARLMADHQ